jgi:hypothetical protein
MAAAYVESRMMQQAIAQAFHIMNFTRTFRWKLEPSKRKSTRRLAQYRWTNEN